MLLKKQECRQDAGDPSGWNASTLLASFNVAQASRLFLFFLKSQARPLSDTGKC